jgi:hypothetical protein
VLGVRNKGNQAVAIVGLGGQQAVVPDPIFRFGGTRAASLRKNATGSSTTSVWPVW